jgi:hypothetical protein
MSEKDDICWKCSYTKRCDRKRWGIGEPHWNCIYKGVCAYQFYVCAGIIKEEKEPEVETGLKTHDPETAVKCPHCEKANLVQHSKREDLLICPLCWHKYDKAAALKGEFILVRRGQM